MITLTFPQQILDALGDAELGERLPTQQLGFQVRRSKRTQAAQLASLAQSERLCLFLGAGVSANAGMPWLGGLQTVRVAPMPISSAARVVPSTPALEVVCCRL